LLAPGLAPLVVARGSACSSLWHTLGVFPGPVLAILLLWLTADHFQSVFWIAVIPAFLSVGVLLVAVKEPRPAPAQRHIRMPLHRDELQRLGPAYWRVVTIAALFTLARFSEAFLILRAQSIGLSLAMVPLVLVIMSFAYSLSAYPVGWLSDKMNRFTLLALGLAILCAAAIVLAFATGMIERGIGVALWGLHMGCTQGLLATLVADTAPPELRGTAFGMFNLITGLALLVASVLAGALWDLTGPQGTFLAGAAFTMLTLAGLIANRRRLARQAASGY